MSDDFEVIWAKSAEDDLMKIIDYMADESPGSALKIFKKIKKSALNLNSSPERGRIVPELRDQGILQYRELIVSPWRMIYRISELKVFVLSVLDSRRNIEDILMTRFTNYEI